MLVRNFLTVSAKFNPLNAELNPICHLLALVGARHILHVSGVRVNIDCTQWSTFILWQSTGHQSSQQIRHIFIKPDMFITVFTRARQLSLSLASSVPCKPIHNISLRSISIASSHLCLGLPTGDYPRVSLSRLCMHLSSSLGEPHALSISFSLIRSAGYLVRGTNREDLHSAGFFSFLLLPPLT